MMQNKSLSEKINNRLSTTQWVLVQFDWVKAGYGQGRRQAVALLWERLNRLLAGNLI